MLVQHIVALRQISDYKHATFVFVPESNLAFEGPRLMDVIERSGLKRVVPMKEDENRAGVKTNNKLKDLMATTLHIKMIERSMFIHDKFVVTAEKSTRDTVLEDLRQHLTHYSRIIVPNEKFYVAPRIFYSGKHGPGDDLTIALQLNLVMRNRFYESDAYVEYRRSG